jgi:host factor-I protein
MTKPQNLQDTFLNQARGARLPLTVFLVNGFQLRGIVTGFDNFTVVLDSEGKQQLIYKHAISTIIPSRPINLAAERETADEE